MSTLAICTGGGYPAFLWAIFTEMVFTAFHTLRRKATHLTGMAVPLISVTLFWVVTISEHLNINRNVTQFFDLVYFFKVFLGEYIDHIQGHPFPSYVVFKHCGSSNL